MTAWLQVLILTSPMICLLSYESNTSMIMINDADQPGRLQLLQSVSSADTKLLWYTVAAAALLRAMLGRHSSFDKADRIWLHFPSRHLLMGAAARTLTVREPRTGPA